MSWNETIQAMMSQSPRSPAPALEADPRAVELLATARMQEEINDSCVVLVGQIGKVKEQWVKLNKPQSEIAELQSMFNWSYTVRDRLLSMADECDKEFAELDENVRDEAEQALG